MRNESTMEPGLGGSNRVTAKPGKTMRAVIPIWIAALAVGCASRGIRDQEPLPFHVAVVPVQVEKVELIQVDENKRAKVALEIDGARLSQVMTEALDGKAFARASLMQLPDEAGAGAPPGDLWVAQARALGADLILETDLEYDEDVSTEINDRFWLNLPLFLLGGPATWFVNDRSYGFQVQIRAYVYDVAAAVRQGDVLDPDSRVFFLDREVKEVSLDFLDRADGAGSYLLSILIPSGFLAKNSKNVSEELELAIGDQLSTSLNDAMRDRSPELIESDKLVAFHPEDLELRQEDGEYYLEGEMVLDLRPESRWRVANLSGCRVRIDEGEWIEASWSEVTTDPQQRERRFKLQVPVGSAAPESIQVEVQQEDREARARSYTYVPGTRGTSN